MTKNKKIFVVVGRLGTELIVSRVLPMLKAPYVSKVYIFSESEGIPIDGAEYFTVPKSIRNIKPFFLYKFIRIVFEFSQLLFYSVKINPSLIIGVYTLPCGLYSLIVSKITKIKCVISVIGGTIEVETYYKFKNFWKGLNLWMLRKSNIVTTMGSNVTKYLIRNGIKSDKIIQYTGAIDTKRFVSSNVYRDIDILFVGTLRNLKGPDRVIKVVNNLYQEISKIKAYIVGKGYLYNDLKKMINKLGLENHIKLESYVKTTVPYYQRAKLLIMPSRSEGLAMTMLEAMACGCVPIVSNVGNMTQAAHHNVNAMVVNDYTDIETFTKYAKELLMDKTKREMLSRNGYELVTEKYSVETQARIIENIFTYT